jgi:hypothetical protein
MKRYQIELNETQLVVLQEALEFYSRFLHGQVEKIPFSLDFRLKNECRPHYSNPVLDEALGVIKKEMFGLKNPGASYAIGARKINTLEEDKELPEPQIAYEMYKMILYLWRQESITKSVAEGKDPGWTVHDYLPLHYSDHPFIKIKKIQPDGEE